MIFQAGESIMLKRYIQISCISIAFLTVYPASARQQPYMGQPGESPQLVKCKQEAQYMGGGSRGIDTQAENNRLMRKEYISKCMKGQ